MRKVRSFVQMGNYSERKRPSVRRETRLWPQGNPQRTGQLGEETVKQEHIQHCFCLNLAVGTARAKVYAAKLT